MKWAIIAVLAALCAIPAKADTIYKYAGNPRGNAEINGEFILPATFVSPPYGQAAVDPLAFFFTDGAAIFNQNNSVGYFSLMTTPAGLVDQWHVLILEGSDWLYTEFGGSADEATDSSQAMYIEGDKGSWTVTQTPEPRTWLLLGMACGLLFLFRKRMARA